ncbi:glycoside hydrolase family 3 C-terminal domain-containing protein [Gracilibacillus sp. S3-1-1]|uniref:Glycoside hydrolase family 3 C-terminal domain-containing protein n=1 Tax=Gracilibacillus pellucidus TaxID=3095368 RepID=A0ACC6M3T6_9BACI|nr:glycoside hydrolase family 3 C-terminal domain-containing protein [Gracilibacillus sp. S3-1-1]MDX8045625.1 glycoside hydrolase family 3 C-terminal domain-containing protein [Gracilibacillus sp. S3-1-1]
MQGYVEKIKELTLEEKAGLCSGLDFWHLKGIERLGIPSVMVTDGPHGLRKQAEGADHLGLHNSVPSTCFPSAAGLASSWDKELIYRVGEALGDEAQAEEVAVLLGPGANIKRSPLCGRNFEYFSEDPYLSSAMATNHIKGVQSKGIGTSLKHFAANNQEHRRMSVDAVVDERTLREIYLASFEEAVKKAQPWTVMCAYNKVNGDYASENHRLLTEILRDEWGFEGFVVSDWGAVNERVAGLKAGLELEMPASNGINDKKLVDAVKAGELKEETLDLAVERILNIIDKAITERKENATYDKEKHHQFAREVAAESMVLLKNEGNLLPLQQEAKLAVIGSFATKPRIQGGGSSHINPTKVDSVLEELKAYAGNTAYAEGYNLENDAIDHDKITEAKEIAKSAEIAVIFTGLPDRYESEGYDRDHLQIPENHRLLIEAVTEVQPNTVIVLSNGAPIEMPWLNRTKAVVEGYLGGQAFGGAIADVLFGKVNPSGRLAETFPKKVSDNPSHLNFPGEGDIVEYKEGIFVGYRYYDTKQIEPLFPFGYGLSYTTFDYSNLQVAERTITDQEELEVSVTVKNTGKVAGKEVVQLYVKDVISNVNRPEKELKSFTKVALEPGQEENVTFTLDKRSFAYYNVDLADWYVESGEFVIMIGKSSQEIVLEETVTVESTVELPVTVHRNTLMGDLMKNDKYKEEAKALLANSPLASMGAEEEQAGSEMMEAMMQNMPLRAMVTFSGGAFTDEMLEDLIKKLNQL